MAADVVAAGGLVSEPGVHIFDNDHRVDSDRVHRRRWIFGVLEHCRGGLDDPVLVAAARSARRVRRNVLTDLPTRVKQHCINTDLLHQEVWTL